MNTRHIGKRIENLEVRLKSSISEGYVDPFEAASPEELAEMIESFKETCRSAEEKCGDFFHPCEARYKDLEEPDDLRLRARFWARQAVSASINIMTWGDRARR